MGKKAAGRIGSMTGFARVAGGDDGLTWAWEVKSVNGKGLDMRSRLPPGFEALDPVLRKALQEAFSRGNFQINLTVKRSALANKVTVNQGVLDQLIELAAELRHSLGAEPPRVEGLLGLKGVLESTDEEESPEVMEARMRVMRGDLDECLAALAEMRREEGGRLAALMTALLEDVENLTAEASATAATQPDALRQRFETQLETFLADRAGLSEERLHQEVALMASKADIREELDRLRAHLAAARDHLARGGVIGRKLDFLCQEFNREANTLCSKSADVELTRIGLAMKTTIEQLREQVQNIE